MSPQSYKCGLLLALMFTAGFFLGRMLSQRPATCSSSDEPVEFGLPIPPDVASNEDRPERETPSDLKHRMPSAMIIGARKCGTETLKDFLSINPYIRVPPKEYYFFDEPSKYKRGADYYMTLMPEAGTGDIVVDKVPRYFSNLHTHGKIYQMMPNLKIFLVLRDPTNRTISDYVHLQAQNRLSRDLSFEEVVLTKSGKVNGDTEIVKQGKYNKFLTALLEWYPRNQIMYINGEDFVRDPYPIVKEAERFLGAPDYIRDSDFIFDERKGFYCKKNKGMTACMPAKKGRPHPYVEPELIKKLQRYFKHYNQKLKDLINKDWAWLST